MPPLAILLGIGGLIPFIGCGLGAMGGGVGSDKLLGALIAYGAVILSFLGGLQWGLALPSARTNRQQWRLALGVVPPLIAWGALLLTLVLPGWVALAVLAAAFVATALGEQRASAETALPQGYMLLRWGLTLIAVAMLVTVLTVRVLGLRVV
jgi:hypothetical protein